MFVVQNRQTGEYHGYCHTVGDSIWLDDISNGMVEKYDTIQSLKGDMNWVPWHWWWTKYRIVEV